VGDSRAYLWRAGTLMQLTEDHSLVGEMLRSGQITSAEAEDHPQRSIITRALGVDSEIDIDTRSIDWAPGDVFLLCSDGLYSMVSDEGIAAVLAQGGDLDTSAGELVEAANAGGGRDNISVVLFSPDGARTGTAAAPATSAEAASGKTRGLLSRLRSWFSTVTGRIGLGVALAVLLLAGGWLLTRKVYYLGVSGDQLAVYQGVPYELGPLSLSTLYRGSEVMYGDLQPFEQERVSRKELQTQSGAETMLANYTAQYEERKSQADRKAAEDAARARTSTQPATVPAGG
jgi:protein phosphatase